MSSSPKAVAGQAKTPIPPYPHPSGETVPNIDKQFVPNHVAIVMDGNGRWANQRGLPRTGMGWEVQPEGLTRILARVARDYAPQIALYVTENGVAYDDVADADGQVHDTERADFVRAHLNAVLDAVEAGVDVHGYFYWSLMDNYEWAWGYAKRFGVVRVDYDTQQRTIKQSGREYARIIAARAL